MSPANKRVFASLALLALFVVALALYLSPHLRWEAASSAVPPASKEHSLTPSAPTTPGARAAEPSNAEASGSSRKPIGRSDRKSGATLLPAESAFLQDGMLRQEVALSALSSDRFDELTASLETQAASNSLASDLTRLYGDSLNEQWCAADPHARPGRIACGTTLCVGSVTTEDSSAWDDWLKRFDADPRTPSYALAEQPIDRGGGAIEHRFVFSTDPSSNSIVVPPSRQ